MANPDLAPSPWYVYEVRGSSEVWTFTREDWSTRHLKPAVWWFSGFDTEKQAKDMRQGPGIVVRPGRHWLMLTEPGMIVVNAWSCEAWFETEALRAEYVVAEMLCTPKFQL